MTKRIVQFYVLTFAISWLLWSPFYFVEDLAEFWALPGAWGPTIAAIILTGLHSGTKGIKTLLRKLTIWKVPFKYYAFAIAGILGIGLLSLLCFRVIVGGLARF